MKSQEIRVVLVDDEIHIRYLLRNIIKTEGYVVVGEANNGEDAIEMYRKQRPDLILMDINLPLKTGDQVLAEILHEFPDAKVVMLTMVADADTVKRCFEIGAIDYILKNVPVDEIRHMLREIVANIRGKEDAHE
jgi:two-component system chemotaxis response regulator CheY